MYTRKMTSQDWFLYVFVRVVLCVGVIWFFQNIASAQDAPEWVRKAQAGETSWVEGYTTYGVGMAPKMTNSSLQRSTAENRARMAAARADKGIPGASVKEISQEIWQSPDGTLYVLKKIVRAPKNESVEDLKGLERSANVSVADQIMKFAGSFLTYDEGKRLESHLARMKKEGLEAVEKAKKACGPKETEDCLVSIIEANGVIMRRIDAEKSLLDTLTEDTKEGIKELKELLEKEQGKTPI